MYIASQFVKPFRFEDVYLGILAKECGIELYHNERFSMENMDDLNYTIASHDLSELDTKEREKIWLRQKSYGHTWYFYMGYRYQMKLLICNLLNILIFVFDTKLQIIDFAKCSVI